MVQHKEHKKRQKKRHRKKHERKRWSDVAYALITSPWSASLAILLLAAVVVALLVVGPTNIATFAYHLPLTISDTVLTRQQP